MAYAQTNIQLYGQLFQAGWADADLRRVQTAYGLAMTIFAGHFRPNHKSFLAHVVGTGSILAAHGGDSSIVAAGLLHSAYSHGEFGDGSRGITAAKTRKVRRTVGEHCETLIARYTSLRWKLSEIVAFANGADYLPALDRSVTFIKLADVLEDHLERGMQYSPNKQSPGGSDADGEWRNAFVRLATALDHDRLAAELQVALRPTDDRPVPDFLLGHEPGSFVVTPVSHHTRATVQLGRLYRRWRAKLTAPGRRPIDEAA
jgi:(p)ppGpp synthase/HD superfamily hydrolase